MAGKCAQLRVFEDENGKMNRGFRISEAVFFLYHSLHCTQIVNGEGARDLRRLHAVSLLSRCTMHLMRNYGRMVSRWRTGIFGADMKVELLNDGPVTIMLDSEEW